MKKLISVFMVAAVVLCAAMFTGCNDMVNDTSSNTSSTAIENGEKSENADSSFEKFTAYMEEGGYIKGSGEELTASAVGAEYGERYTISSGGSKIYVELYEYTDTDSALAQEILSEAADKGTFSLYKDLSTENTSAAVSADGKYLMLYTDSSSNANNIQTKNDAIEAVKSYSGK